MGFGHALCPELDVLIIALKIFTTLSWAEIVEAMSTEFNVDTITAGDCRNRWARPLKLHPVRLTLEAQHGLGADENAQVVTYLQKYGILDINDAGRALLNNQAPGHGPTPSLIPDPNPDGALPLAPILTHDASALMDVLSDATTPAPAATSAFPADVTTTDIAELVHISVNTPSQPPIYAEPQLFLPHTQGHDPVNRFHEASRHKITIGSWIFSNRLSAAVMEKETP